MFKFILFASESLHELFNAIYQQYHLDVCYEISDFTSPVEAEVVFTISCPAVEDGTAKIEVVAKCSFDDDLSEESICNVDAKAGNGEVICKAEIRVRNGNGYEGEEGIVEVSENTEYDDFEMNGFRDDLLIAVSSLNPYPTKLEAWYQREKHSLNQQERLNREKKMEAEKTLASLGMLKFMAKSACKKEIEQLDRALSRIDAEKEKLKASYEAKKREAIQKVSEREPSVRADIERRNPIPAEPKKPK